MIHRLLEELDPAPGPPNAPEIGFEVDDEYLEFASVSNGGFIGNRYFHLFGSSGEVGHDIRDWNAADGWKSHFDHLPEFWVIAEDFLGNQYGYRKVKNGSRLCLLCVLTGEVSRCPDTFSDFIEYMLLDPPYPLSPLFDTWTDTHGQFPMDSHLSWIVHPLLGGPQDDLQNLELTGRLPHMQLTGQLLSQIRKLPPGTVIRDVQVKDGTLTLIT